MRSLVASPAFLSFVLIYAVSVAVLAGKYGYGPGEPLMILGIFGLLLPGIVLAITRGFPKHADASVRNPAGECRDISVYLLVVIAFLVYGLDAIRASVHDEPLRSLCILSGKLAVFVVAPAVLFRMRGYRWSELFAFRLNMRDVVTLVIIGGLFILVNGVVGQGPERIANSGYPLVTARSRHAIHLSLSSARSRPGRRVLLSAPHAIAFCRVDGFRSQRTVLRRRNVRAFACARFLLPLGIHGSRTVS
jgi:hypothetical protein